MPPWAMDSETNFSGVPVFLAMALPMLTRSRSESCRRSTRFVTVWEGSRVGRTTLPWPSRLPSTPLSVVTAVLAARSVALRSSPTGVSDAAKRCSRSGCSTSRAGLRIWVAFSLRLATVPVPMASKLVRSPLVMASPQATSPMSRLGRLAPASASPSGGWKQARPPSAGCAPWDAVMAVLGLSSVPIPEAFWFNELVTTLAALSADAIPKVNLRPSRERSSAWALATPLN